MTVTHQLTLATLLHLQICTNAKGQIRNTVSRHDKERKQQRGDQHLTRPLPREQILLRVRLPPGHLHLPADVPILLSQ